MQWSNFTKCGFIFQHSLPCGPHTSSICVAARRGATGGGGGVGGQLSPYDFFFFFFFFFFFCLSDQRSVMAMINTTTPLWKFVGKFFGKKCVGVPPPPPPPPTLPNDYGCFDSHNGGCLDLWKRQEVVLPRSAWSFRLSNLKWAFSTWVTHFCLTISLNIARTPPKLHALYQLRSPWSNYCSAIIIVSHDIPRNLYLYWTLIVTISIQSSLWLYTWQYY